MNADIPDFHGEFKLSENVNLPQSPLSFDVFSLCITPSIVNYIVEQTNLYRIQQDMICIPMSLTDFYQQLSFLFYSSLVRLPCKGDYRSAKTEQKIISSNITINRVDELLRMLHFNENILSTEKYDKVQSFIDLFNEHCELLAEQQ